MAFDVPTCLYESKSPFCYQNELSFLVPQNGGDKRDRTADLLNAIQALSRLVRLHTPLNRVKRALQYAGNPKTHPECLSL